MNSYYRGLRPNQLLDLQRMSKQHPHDAIDEKLLAVAHHEVGHAIVALAKKWEITEFSVKRDYTGYCGFKGSPPPTNWARLCFFVAGEEAKRMFGKDPTFGGVNDLPEIERLSWLVDAEAPARTIVQAREEVRRLLQQHRAVVTALANALHDRGSMTHKEIKKVVAAFPPIAGLRVYRPAPKVEATVLHRTDGHIGGAASNATPVRCSDDDPQYRQSVRAWNKKMGYARR